MRRLVALSSTTSTRSPARSRRRPRRGCVSVAAQPGGEGEGAARPGVAVGPDVAAHQLDQLPRDRQPQARSAVAAGGRGCRPGRTHRTVRRMAAGSMPMPVSVTAKRSTRRRRRTARLTRTTTSPPVGELDRVGDQVDQHLAHAVAVAARRPGTSSSTRTLSSSPLSWACRRAARRRRRRCRARRSGRGRARACRPRSWRGRGCR